VDRGTTRKVETTELERPAVGVPSPAGDGIVDDRFPYEHKDEHWSEFATFSNGTGCDDDSDRCEHELVDTEDDGRNANRTDGRSIECIL